MNKTQKGIIEWLANGHTGMGSETIAFYLGFGIIRKEEGRFHSHDPSDFNCCLLLLKAVPGLRKKLPEMAKLSKEWKRLVAHWSDIEASLIAEVGDTWGDNGLTPVPAIQTNQLMKQVLAGKRKKR
jgi:hypothetical protein